MSADAIQWDRQAGPLRLLAPTGATDWQSRVNFQQLVPQGQQTFERVSNTAATVTHDEPTLKLPLLFASEGKRQTAPGTTRMSGCSTMCSWNPAKAEKPAERKTPHWRCSHCMVASVDMNNSHGKPDAPITACFGDKIQCRRRPIILGQATPQKNTRSLSFGC